MEGHSITRVRGPPFPQKWSRPLYSPDDPQVVGRGPAAPGTPTELSYEVLGVLVEAVGAGTVLAFSLGSVVITIVGIVRGGVIGVFVSPCGVVHTDGNVLVVHIGVVEVHVVEALLGEPDPGPQLPGGALLLRLVPRYAGIHAPRTHDTSLRLRPLQATSAGIKHDINQQSSRRSASHTHSWHTVLPTLLLLLGGGRTRH